MLRQKETRVCDKLMVWFSPGASWTAWVSVIPETYDAIWKSDDIINAMAMTIGFWRRLLVMDATSFSTLAGTDPDTLGEMIQIQNLEEFMNCLTWLTFFVSWINPCTSSEFWDDCVTADDTSDVYCCTFVDVMFSRAVSRITMFTHASPTETNPNRQPPQLRSFELPKLLPESVHPSEFISQGYLWQALAPVELRSAFEINCDGK